MGAKEKGRAGLASDYTACSFPNCCCALLKVCVKPPKSYSPKPVSVSQLLEQVTKAVKPQLSTAGIALCQRIQEAVIPMEEELMKTVFALFSSRSYMDLSCDTLRTRHSLQVLATSHGIIVMWEKRRQRKFTKRVFAWKSIFIEHNGFQFLYVRSGKTPLRAYRAYKVFQFMLGQ